MLHKAREFAMQAHGEQMYGDKPYITHLDAVVSHLSTYGETARVIGYLHDVIEDTPATYDDILAHFGPFIADCVSLLTDEQGRNRKERKRKTYAKMARISGDLELALIVKAADRLANLQACVQNGNAALLRMYREEHQAFKAAVYRRNLCEDIWQQIDNTVQG